MDDSDEDPDNSRHSDESTPSSLEMRPSVKHPHKRRLTNVIISEEEEEEDVSVEKLGKRYRVEYESPEE